MTSMRGTALAAILLMASGCATTSDIRQFTVTDLNAALVTATKGNDRPAMQCLPHLIERAEARQAEEAAPPPPPPAGGVDALEILRVAIHQPAAGASAIEDLNLHCAAWRDSIAHDVGKGLLMGAKASAGGAAILPAALEAARILRNLLKR